MVWTPRQCGAFLDSARAERGRAAVRTVPRGRLLRAAPLGAGRARLGRPRPRAAARSTSARPRSTTCSTPPRARNPTARCRSTRHRGRAPGWRKEQLAERLAWGPAWTDSGRVFTREDGTPLRPGLDQPAIRMLAARGGLPPIRFHDLRHGTATMLLAAGQPLRSSPRSSGMPPSSFTMDVYTEVAEELADAAAASDRRFTSRGRWAAACGAGRGYRIPRLPGRDRSEGRPR